MLCRLLGLRGPRAGEVGAGVGDELGRGHPACHPSVPWGWCCLPVNATCRGCRRQLPPATLGVVTVPCRPGDSETQRESHESSALPSLPAVLPAGVESPSAAPLALPVPTVAPRSLPAGDAKPEIIVKVEPEDELYIGYPRGLGDPGAPGHPDGTGEHWGSSRGSGGTGGGVGASALAHWDTA